MPNETTNEDGVRGNVSRRNFFMRIGVAGAAAATTTPWSGISSKNLDLKY